MSLIEPAIKRVIAFIDGQNLFHHSCAAFGYRYPNYDVRKLVETISSDQGWNLTEVCFYTGVPDAADNPKWNRFWTNKLSSMGRQGISIFTRPLKYRNKTVDLPDEHSIHFCTERKKALTSELLWT